MCAPLTPPGAGAARTLGIDIVDSIDFPTILIGSDGAVVRFNPAAATLMSLTPANLGRPSREIPLLRDVKRLEELCQEAMCSGSSSQWEVRDATIGSWFILRIAPYLGSEQRINNAVLTFQNVTAFRASLGQAVYEREYTKAILNTVIDSLVVLNDDCRVQAANQAFYTKFQVSRDQAHNARLYDIGSQDWEVPRLRKFLKETDAESQSDAEFEHEFPAIGRRTVMLSARRLPLKAAMSSQGGNVREMTLLIIQDITERKQAELATASLAAIVDSSEDAIVSKNLDGVITSWNKGAERIFGYTSEEAVDKHISLIIPADRLDEEKDILLRLRRGERIEHFETVRQRKDGTALDISAAISPVKAPSGRIIGASKVARDISSRKQSDIALRQSEERFRKLSESLEAEVRVRTTELEERNLEVLTRAEQVRQLSWQVLRIQDEERRHIARELHDSAGQSLTVLGMNLATIAKNAKRQAPEFTESIEQVLEIVQELTKEIRTTSYLLHPPLLDENGLPAALSWYIRGLSERSGLDIGFTISEEFGRLPRDLELTVFRLVQECLTNIHRHSGSKTATIQINRDPDRILIEVHDQGKGIPRERLAQIEGGISGVGIRGIRERLRQFKGEMILDSAGAGTTVVVTIPLTKNIRSGDVEAKPLESFL
jgi:PAS domain S-box-containing protein